MCDNNVTNVDISLVIRFNYNSEYHWLRTLNIKLAGKLNIRSLILAVVIVFENKSKTQCSLY